MITTSNISFDLANVGNQSSTMKVEVESIVSEKKKHCEGKLYAQDKIQDLASESQTILRLRV